jgi:hypothetical protein
MCVREGERVREFGSGSKNHVPKNNRRNINLFFCYQMWQSLDELLSLEPRVLLLAQITNVDPCKEG